MTEMKREGTKKNLGLQSYPHICKWNHKSKADWFRLSVAGYNHGGEQRGEGMDESAIQESQRMN